MSSSRGAVLLCVVACLLLLVLVVEQQELLFNIKIIASMGSVITSGHSRARRFRAAGQISTIATQWFLSAFSHLGEKAFRKKFRMTKEVWCCLKTKSACMTSTFAGLRLFGFKSIPDRSSASERKVSD
jgi:hypothetical protein